ncbi:MAG TPA: inositol monophosphatase [Candidatus Dormibacteraeota bacterium]
MAEVALQLNPVEWLSVFAEIGAKVRERTAGLMGSEAGRMDLTQGAGGDITVELDRVAEATCLEVLDRVASEGATFAVLSEEIGHRRYGADLPLILIDPIDGSLNAKQGLPIYAVMLALHDGVTLGDALVGYVLNLATGDTWHAVRGEGAFRNGAAIQPLPMKPGRREFEMVALESSPRSVLRARPLLERCAKLRVLGCMSLSIVHAATGGVDVFCAPFKARAFDMSASLLIMRETGGIATDCEGADVAGVRAGLDSRTSLLVASDAGYHRRALDALRAS